MQPQWELEEKRCSSGGIYAENVSGQLSNFEPGFVAAPSLLALQSALAWEQRRSKPEFHRQCWNPDNEHPSIQHRVKRLFDIACAIAILFLLLPLFLFCAALLAIDSPGPLFYKQRRLGLAGKQFRMWKFRTMCVDSERVLERYLDESPQARQEWLETHKLTADPRVTRLGRLMRKLSIDEFPQLLNVVAGEMSLIGPRPIVTAEIDKYGEAIQAYYAVRPGMTGLWQVSGRSNTTYSQRIDLDKRYVNQWSLALDAEIFLKTFKVLARAEGAY